MTPVCAFDITPEGQAAAAAELSPEAPERGYRWIHLDLTDPESRAWVAQALPDRAAATLLQAETRPRCDRTEEGLVLNLRAINLNDGQESEDMVSLRLWVQERVIVSGRLRKVFALEELKDRAEAGTAPGDEGAFLAQMADRLVDRIEEASVGFGARMDDVDDAILEGQEDTHNTLGPLRRKAIQIYRFARPQRDAVARLAQVEALPEAARLKLAETALRLTRSVEELEAVRDRGIAAQDHLDAIHAARLSRNSYALSIVAAVFLPLGFLTGLFGVNVGGVPGLEVPWAFAVLCAAMVVSAGLVLWLFRRLKWI